MKGIHRNVTTNKRASAPAAPEVLSASETAAYLKLDVGTTKKQLRAGAIPGAKFGKLWRVRRDVLDGLMLGTTPKPTTRASTGS